MSNTKTNPQTKSNGPKQTQFRIKFKANNIKKNIIIKNPLLLNPNAWLKLSLCFP